MCILLFFSKCSVEILYANDRQEEVAARGEGNQVGAGQVMCILKYALIFVQWQLENLLPS